MYLGATCIGCATGDQPEVHRKSWLVQKLKLVELQSADGAGFAPAVETPDG